MEQEIYIDLFFLENLVMDAAILTASAMFLRLPLAWKKLVTGALTGSAGSCLLSLLLPGASLSAGAGASLPLCLLMTGLCFPCSTFQGRMLRLLTVYGVSFLLRGILYWLALLGLPVLAMTCGGLAILLLGQWAVKRLEHARDLCCSVRFRYMDQVLILKGYMDTGNTLTDPVTGNPAAVCGLPTLDPYLTDASRAILRQSPSGDPGDRETLPEGLPGFHYVPYHTVGTDHGVLPVIIVDRAVVRWQDTSYVLRKMPLAISTHLVSNDNRYQLLLNPALCDRSESL